MSRNDHHPYVYILSGGIGSRFWPKSREYFPKQFIDILGFGQSLIQLTAKRFAGIADNEHIHYITHKDYRDLILQQLPETPVQNILTEPDRRNTAPCIAYAAFKLYQQDPDAVMVIVPSDHLILKEENYIRQVEKAIAYASQQEDVLVTLGITPSRPDTGYGYIRYAKNSDDKAVFPVLSFEEKPSLEKAKVYLRDGNYLWNAGMFIWKASAIIAAFKLYSPEIYEVFQSGAAVYNTTQEAAFIAANYSKVPDVSIDYAVMEKASNVYTLPSDIGWSDVGTWDSLYDMFSGKDARNNAAISGQARLIDSENCMISAPPGKLLIVKGLKDYIIVDDKNVLLIYPKSEEQDIKKITEQLKHEAAMKDYL